MIIEDLKLWSTENELVEAMYQREGIMVRDYCNSDICYIFFSSNDLFYPNTTIPFLVCTQPVNQPKLSVSPGVILIPASYNLSLAL